MAQSSPTYYPPLHSYSYSSSSQQVIPQYTHAMHPRLGWAPRQYPQFTQYGQTPLSTGAGAQAIAVHYIPHPPAGNHPHLATYVSSSDAKEHKRLKRRHREIRRMYKCGWNGCEKAYGTLNHLNAHVTMQSHGSKRTPKEFKGIRKEWKVVKKEENQRKQEQDRQLREAQGQCPNVSQPDGQAVQYGQPHVVLPTGGSRLPTMWYQAGAGPYTLWQQVDGAHQYVGNGDQMYCAQGYSQSPYGQSGLPYQP